jgi:hypothetical protein
LGYLVFANGSKKQTPKQIEDPGKTKGEVMGIVMSDWKLEARTPSTLCEINQEERRITMGILVTE